MLIINKPMAFIGLILVFMAGFCPMLEVKILVKWISWNLLKTDPRLFLITYSFIAITALCFFIRQLKAFRLLSRVMFVWVLLMAAAVYFKTTHYFGMKIADNLLGKAIHFQWGWIILLIGAILLLFSVKKERLEVQ